MNLESHGHTYTINEWHARARPNPNAKDFNVQLGCHLEEIVEMVELLGADTKWMADALCDLVNQLTEMADALKSGDEHVVLSNHVRKAFLDSLCDQVVTGIGVAHCAGMNIVGGLAVVDQSNWSKYDANGQPMFDANGKIAKGPNYRKPNLEGMY